MARLLACLGHRNELPSPETAPTPTDLGLPLMCDGELTPHALQSRSHALTKWSLALDNERHRGRPNRSRARQLASEHAEIAALRQRLAELFTHSRAINDTVAANAAAANVEPCWLPSADQTRLGLLLGNVERHHRLPALARWYARIVYWLSGATAAARYVDCLGPVVRPEEVCTAVEQLRRFQWRLHDWKRRTAQERRRELHAELRTAISQLPPSVTREAKLVSRLRGRTFEAHCTMLHGRCAEELKRLAAFQLRRAPAAMAALAACDNSSSPLPVRLMSQCIQSADHDAFERCVLALKEESTQPGYDRLLVALTSLDPLPGSDVYPHIRQILAGGGTLDDIAWAEKHSLTRWFDRPSRRTAWLRNFLETHEQRGLNLDPSRVWLLLNAAKENKGIAVLEQWQRWLGKFQRAAFTPRMEKIVLKGLSELVAPGLAQLACHGLLRYWAAPPSRRRRTIAAFPDMSTELRGWLCRIGFYQKLLGQNPAVPKSLRKQLDAADRQNGERAYLEKLVADGRAGDSQVARLKYVAQRSASVPKSTAAQLTQVTELLRQNKDLGAILALSLHYI